MVQYNKKFGAPYEQDYFTSLPSRRIRFLRTCILWQLVRFVFINLRMILMIRKSHSSMHK